MDTNIDLRLFSTKELYRMAHDARGNSTLLKKIPPTKRRKVMDDNMHLMSGMKFDHGYPILKPYTGSVDLAPVAYSERTENPQGNCILHFFLDDYRFRDAIWYNLERTTYSISQYDYVFTPDLSLWRNLPTEFFNEKNLFRTRFVGAYWQICGFYVIPTASWGGLNSFTYCFSGLPEESVIAVSAMGARNDQKSFDLWCYGINRLVIEKGPTLILIYGDEFNIPGLTTPVKFLPTFVTKHFRNGNKSK